MIDSDTRAWARSTSRALFALAHVCDPADQVIDAHRRQHGAGETLVRLVEGAIRHRSREVYGLRWSRIDLDEEWARARTLGVQVLTPLDDAWPAALVDSRIAEPHVLWVLGSRNLAEVSDLSVAIVGARACTHYGSDVARTWAADLAAGGVVIVSGGAFGIDVAAHSGALAAGGRTIVVTAGGVDVPYPRAHHGLFVAVQRRGCVVSETPLGLPVRRARFLTRNRLIAGMARGTLLVEAARRSGSLSTARHAEEFGRIVMAVPGPVTSGASVGCNQWIAERRAEVVVSSADVAALLTGPDPRCTGDEEWRLPPALSSILDALPASGGSTLDDLVAASGMTRPQVARAVEELTALAAVVAGDGRWSRATR